jgi:putative chitinase
MFSQVTQEQLHCMIPHATDRSINLFYTPLMLAMKEFEINTKLRIAAFIAQIAHESGSLLYTEELASGSAYEYRRDLGNLKEEALTIAHANYTTTGKYYKGRGLIQITGYDNYASCARALKVNCDLHPSILSRPDLACRSAAWFFSSHGCNKYADEGNFDRISKIINGGPLGRSNGWEERNHNYEICLEVLSTSKPTLTN